MKRIGRIILSTIFFLVIAAIAILLLSSKFGLMGLHSYIVQTGSMTPTIQVGSVVFTYPSATYTTGDVITFKRDDRMITHRIYKVTDKNFVVKGDANKTTDPQPVFRNDIIGKDILHIPYMGRFVEYIKTVQGFLLFVALPIVLYIAYEIRNIKKELEIAIEKRVLEKHKLAEEHD